MNNDDGLKKIIKKAIEEDMSRFDDVKPVSDEEMIYLGQELPPEDMLEKIKNKLKTIKKEEK